MLRHTFRQRLTSKADMKRVVVLILLCFTALLRVNAQVPESKTAIIEGIAPGKPGTEIKAFVISDYITRTETPVGTATLTDKGSFSMEVEVNSTQEVLLHFENLRGNLFAEPGHTHRVEFPHRDSLRQVSSEVTYDVELNIYSTDSTEMNMLAIDYNIRFEKFWKRNYQHFLYKGNTHLLDSFHDVMRNHYKDVKNPYFMPWMDYSLAALEDATFHPDKKMYSHYLDKKPVYYSNKEYMNFFNSFFDKYLYKHTFKKEGSDISAAINIKGSAEALMAAMADIKWLSDDTLRELVMLKGIFESFNHPMFEKRNMLSIAEQVSQTSKIPEHRAIARNIVSFYTHLQIGSVAPGFTAYDRKGNPVTLESFKGKYVLLSFYTSWNTNAVSEMKVLPDLHKKYSKKITFVSISLDDDTAAHRKFLKQNPKMNWNMLHYGTNQQLKTDYELLAYPAFFIIDPQGRFWASPADVPSGSLEYDLYKIMYPKKKP